MRIQADLPIPSMPQVQVGEKPAEPESDFGQMLLEILRQVNEAQSRAADLAQRFARGEPVEEHQLILAMERAGLALQLTLQVRNRLLEAYQEIMRLQV